MIRACLSLCVILLALTTGQCHAIQAEDPEPPVGLAAMRSDPATYLGKLAGSEYRFLVAGHVYGKPGSHGLFAPFETRLHESGAIERSAFLILTGDTVHHSRPEYFEELDQGLTRVGLPAFCAPGNHDSRKTENSDAFTDRYGLRHKRWWIGSDAFVVADSVFGGGNLVGADLEAIESVSDRKVRFVFVFVHHLVWVDQRRVEQGTESARVVNAIKGGYADQGTFWDEVLPVLQQIPAPVFVIAGDVGLKVAECYRKVGKNVHLLASGVGEKTGCFLEVSVAENGVSFTKHYLQAESGPQLDDTPRIPSSRFAPSRRP